MPISSEIGIHTFFCGPESFTPDLSPVVGEAPEQTRFDAPPSQATWQFPEGEATAPKIEAETPAPVIPGSPEYYRSIA